MALATDDRSTDLTANERKSMVDFRPRTKLGSKLMELRSAMIDSGFPLLDEDEIGRELAERRGGIKTSE